MDYEKELEDVIVAERKSLEYEANENDLLSAIIQAVKEASPLKDLMDDIGDKNELYWRKGTDIEEEKKIHPKKSKIKDNRVFMSVETIIPIVTAKTPEPEIAGEINNTTREKLVKALTIAYEVKLKVKQKLQQVLRHWFIHRIGVWKYRWDEGFVLETVKPKKIGVDPRATCLANCEFIYEQLEDTVGALTEKFPKKKKEILAKYGEDRLKTKVKYLEFWGGGGKWVAWKLGSILLDKQKNPNFDYKNETNNLFKTPQLPYLLLRVFDLGNQLYDDTSLVEQIVSLQDGVNKRKNQISDLIDENKKLIIVSSNSMSKEEAQKFVNKYGMMLIWLDRGNPNEIKVEGGQVDASAFNDLGHSITEIDNLMGTHSTTRGERAEQETLGGRQILAAADYGRAETIAENVEQLLEDLFNAYLHCLKVYSLEDASFSNGEETVTISREEIPTGIVVLVKKGSSLPVDKASRAEMAIKLAQFGMIDPETLFTELGYGNEEKRKQDLFEWLQMTGKIQPQMGMEGQAGGQDQRLVQIQQMLNSPGFQNMPPEKQKEVVGRTRKIVQAIKQGA